MNEPISMSYDAAEKRAILTFPNGRQLALQGVTQEQAETFKAKHGAEFQRRDCCLSTVDGAFTRENGDGV
jgi:hypothetical protein